MEHTDKLDQLLLTWIDNESKRCTDAVAEIQARPNQELWKATIQTYHTEISMYQSFRNKIESFTYNPPTING